MSRRCQNVLWEAKLPPVENYWLRSLGNALQYRIDLYLFIYMNRHRHTLLPHIYILTPFCIYHYIHLHTVNNIYTSVYTYAHIYTYTHIYPHVYIYIQLCIFKLHLCMPLYMYRCIIHVYKQYMHVNISYTCVYIHIYLYACECLKP